MFIGCLPYPEDRPHDGMEEGDPIESCVHHGCGFLCEVSKVERRNYSWLELVKELEVELKFGK